MSEENPTSQLSPEEVVKKGEEIYDKKLKNELEPQEVGKFVAIEIESEKYYVKDTKEEALDCAQNDFPDKLFFVRRIGELERVSCLRSHNPLSHDWLYL